MTYINKKSVLVRILSVLLVLTLLFGVMPISAYAVSQEEIDALKEQRNEITRNKQHQQEIVDILSNEQADVMEKKRALDERNAFTLEQMQLNEEEIQLYSEMIIEKSKDVDAAVENEKQQLERYRVRVRAMEENGTLNILALILKSNNLGELLTTIDDVGEIMERDRQVEDDYIAARINTENVRAEYEAFKTELEAKQEELEEEQVRLQGELDEADALIAQYSIDIAKNAELARQFEEEENAANAEINALIAELEAQRRAAAEAAAAAARAEAAANGGGSGYVPSNPGTVGTGSFGWPVSCTYITSCVGYRYHPITGAWKYHAGMDIGAGYGSTVYASDSGVVSLSGWNGGYGECIIIDHGNGYYTLYGHLSSRAVSEGQSVGKGDVIGYVGSTGNSTGPHLHFEIRDGGGAIDFQSWFSGLSYAPDSGGA